MITVFDLVALLILAVLGGFIVGLTYAGRIHRYIGYEEPRK